MIIHRPTFGEGEVASSRRQKRGVDMSTAAERSGLWVSERVQDADCRLANEGRLGVLATDPGRANFRHLRHRLTEEGATWTKAVRRNLPDTSAVNKLFTYRF